MTSFDHDLTRYQEAAVLHCGPGAICGACWRVSCGTCEEPVGDDGDVDPETGVGDEHGRMLCRSCRGLPPDA